MPSPSALSYEEPGSVTILVLSSFFILLNVVNSFLNRLVYCGLVGQIFIGVAWGLPGAGWLSEATQRAILRLGYLGLILLVYEGGLSTNIKTLRANLYRSGIVAAIGISCPIALSFVLKAVLPITSLQAFAAGAALCSTSLGTTFTVLSTAGLVDTRLGIVLSSAAMMDDVVGLVMVQVVSNLGDANGIDAVTVVRPVLVSIAFAVLVPALCFFFIKPLTRRYCSVPATSPSKIESLLWTPQAAFLIHTALLLGMVTGASYAGTSNLFVAYVAGAAISWWGDLLADIVKRGPAATGPVQPIEPATNTTGTESEAPITNHAERTESIEAASPATAAQGIDELDRLVESVRGVAVYRRYYHRPVEHVLKPMFFASIGFSIPITRMFTGDVVWRGIVYALLMAIGKLACGLCLLRIRSPVVRFDTLIPATIRKWASSRTGKKHKEKASPSTSAAPSQQGERQPETSPQTAEPTSTQAIPRRTITKAETQEPPRSLYPAAILGSAMVSRGEIGFLISSIADARGIFASPGHTTGGTSELFLVVTWAILVCTVLGPLVVGLLVKRVRRLQNAERRMKTGKADPLGVWGVIQ